MFQFFPIPEFWKTLFTSLVGLLTLVGIMTRPFRWNEALIAMAGAGVLLILGLIGPADAFFTLIRDWNTFLFFLGMMGLSALAEAAGLFDWLAVQAARFAGKSAARLFLNVFLLGSLISMLLSNDATALIINSDCLRPGDEASITSSALSFCLYFHCRYRFFFAAGQQSNQYYYHFPVPARPFDFSASSVSAKPGSDRP